MAVSGQLANRNGCAVLPIRMTGFVLPLKTAVGARRGKMMSMRGLNASQNSESAPVENKGDHKEVNKKAAQDMPHESHYSLPARCCLDGARDLNDIYVNDFRKWKGKSGKAGQLLSAALLSWSASHALIPTRLSRCRWISMDDEFVYGRAINLTKGSFFHPQSLTFSPQAIRRFRFCGTLALVKR